MKLYQTFRLLTRGKQIAVGVCLVHLFALLSLCGHHLFTRRMKPARPIVVRMISPIAKTEKPPLREEAAPPQKKSPPAKKEAKPKPAAKPKAAPKKQEPAKPLPVEAPKKKRPALILPSKIEAKTPLPESIEEPNYGEFLIAFLQNALDLPEYGEVKAKLEIDRFGQLVSCEILQTKSSKNAAFLQKQLPELAFPCLNDFGIMDTTQTFTITFRNVEIH